MTPSETKAISGCALVLCAFALILLATPYLLMLTWNFLAAGFGLPAITFWHALAACVLLSVIGGFFRK